MPVVLVATAGASNANSFVSREDADAYFEGSLFASAWPGAGAAGHEEQKDRALISATRILSTARYRGVRTYPAQALAWPRTDVADPDTAWKVFDEGVVPTRVREATCELAVALLAEATNPFGADETAAITSESVAGITTTYAAAGDRVQGLARYPRVLALLRPLFEPAAGATRVRRG